MLFILGFDLVVLIKLFTSGSISTTMLLKYMRVHGGVVVKGEDNIPATKFVKYLTSPSVSSACIY